MGRSSIVCAKRQRLKFTPALRPPVECLVFFSLKIGNDLFRSCLRHTLHPVCSLIFFYVEPDWFSKNIARFNAMRFSNEIWDRKKSNFVRQTVYQRMRNEEHKIKIEGRLRESVRKLFQGSAFVRVNKTVHSSVFTLVWKKGPKNKSVRVDIHVGLKSLYSSEYGKEILSIAKNWGQTSKILRFSGLHLALMK